MLCFSFKFLSEFTRIICFQIITINRKELHVYVMPYQFYHLLFTINSLLLSLFFSFFYFPFSSSRFLSDDSHRLSLLIRFFLSDNKQRLNN